MIDGHELQMSLSIGIAVYPENGLDIDLLMRNADTAMYTTKENGRNSYKFFHPALKPGCALPDQE